MSQFASVLSERGRILRSCCFQVRISSQLCSALLFGFLRFIALEASRPCVIDLWKLCSMISFRVFERDLLDIYTDIVYKSSVLSSKVHVRNRTKREGL
jgi:hypothetical protein